MIELMSDGRPLYDNSADARLFVVPEEWNVLMRAIDRRNNVLVTAPRGWGKTSLLRQVQQSLRDNGHSAAFVDGSALEDGFQLLIRVRRALAGTSSAPQRMKEQFGAIGSALAGDPSPPPPEASYALMNELQAIEGLPETTLLVDASHSAEAVYAIFGRLRDLIWQMPHRWIIVVDEDEAATALKPPADAFFDMVLRLKPWSIERMIMILDRRLEPGDLDRKFVQDIAAGADGNPRKALRAANEAIVTGRPPAASLTDRARVLNQAAALGRPHGMLMAELLDLGQASPSDAALLDRLGLSRGRVTALLRELLDHDLVVAAPDTSSGTTGRPRTIYRPRLEGEL
jgi:hypothetical protein